MTHGSGHKTGHGPRGALGAAAALSRAGRAQGSGLRICRAVRFCVHFPAGHTSLRDSRKNSVCGRNWKSQKRRRKVVSLIHKLPTAGGVPPSRGPGRTARPWGAGPTLYPGPWEEGRLRPQEPRTGSPSRRVLWVQEAPDAPGARPSRGLFCSEGPQVGGPVLGPGPGGAGTPRATLGRALSPGHPSPWP